MAIDRRVCGCCGQTGRQLQIGWFEMSGDARLVEMNAGSPAVTDTTSPVAGLSTAVLGRLKASRT